MAKKCRLQKKEAPLRGEPRTDFVEPRAFMRDLSAMMEDDAILTADVGQNQIWAANNFNTKEGRFLTSGGIGTMGYALPAAIGAKLAKAKTSGSSGFVVTALSKMSMCELATANQNQVPLKLVVMRNGIF